MNNRFVSEAENYFFTALVRKCCLSGF